MSGHPEIKANHVVLYYDADLAGRNEFCWAVESSDSEITVRYPSIEDAVRYIADNKSWLMTN